MGGVLASFTANGSTNPNGPGTGFAPFMGIESLDNTTFARIGFDIVSAGGDTASFAINAISIRQVPEPSSLTIGAAALFGLIAVGLKTVRRPAGRSAAAGVTALW